MKSVLRQPPVSIADPEAGVDPHGSAGPLRRRVRRLVAQAVTGFFLLTLALAGALILAAQMIDGRGDAEAGSAMDIVAQLPWLMGPGVLLLGIAVRLLSGQIRRDLQRDVTATLQAQSAGHFGEGRDGRMVPLDVLPDLAAVVKDGRIIRMNSAGCRMLGLDAEKTTGLALADLLAPSDRQRMSEVLADPAIGRKSDHWHPCDMVGTDGLHVAVLLQMRSLPGNGPQGVLVLARRRSALPQPGLSTLPVAPTASIPLMERARNRFLSGLTHELRTPLNAIIGFSRILQASAGRDPQIRSYSDDIHDSGRHLLSLIDDLLDLARLDGGTFDLREGWIDLPILIDRTRRLVDPALKSGDLQLAVTLDLRGERLLGDETRLKQALQKALEQAISQTGTGGIVQLTVMAAPDGDLCIRITDQGSGLADPLPEQDSLAETVGLPLARGILQAHGGSLTRISVPGVGSVTTLQLPRARLHAPERVLSS
jgi:PAS domain S-box-containing protein